MHLHVFELDKSASRVFALAFRPSVVGILVHAEEEDLVGRLVVDEEGEGVVGDELRVEERARGAEPEEGGGGRRLAPLLVHLDERLVQRAVERDVVAAALGRGVDEPPELARRRVEQRLQPQALKRLQGRNSTHFRTFTKI